MSIYHFIRFWIIPLVSLSFTFLVPASTPWLWVLWGVAFCATLEISCSSWSMARPVFWVGLHMLPIFL